jgi:acetyl esterase/lipase
LNESGATSAGSRSIAPTCCRTVASFGLVPRLSLAIAAGAILCAALPPTASGAVSVRSGVEYGTGEVAVPEPGRANLVLDLYRPSKRFTGARPVVVLIHGGGFRSGDRKNAGLVRTARGLAARGIVAASIDYRLLEQDPEPSARVTPLLAALPEAPISRAIAASADDTLTAIDYLKRNARRLRLDMGRLGLVGSSAGAITANHVAYVLNDHGIRGRPIKFVGSLWGGILVRPPEGRGNAAAVQLERGEPAFFAVHGDRDRTVPVQLSDDLFARARDKRVPVEYHRVQGGAHGFPGSRFFTANVGRGQTPFDRLLRFAGAELR